MQNRFLAINNKGKKEAQPEGFILTDNVALRVMHILADINHFNDIKYINISINNNLQRLAPVA